MPLRLERIGACIGVGAGVGILGPVAGPLAAAGSLAVGTYLQVAAPGAYPQVDEALADSGAALLGRTLAPASPWLGIIALSALTGLVMLEVLDELALH